MQPKLRRELCFMLHRAQSPRHLRGKKKFDASLRTFAQVCMPIANAKYSVQLKKIGIINLGFWVNIFVLNIYSLLLFQLMRLSYSFLLCLLKMKELNEKPTGRRNQSLFL